MLFQPTDANALPGAPGTGMYDPYAGAAALPAAPYS